MRKTEQAGDYTDRLTQTYSVFYTGDYTDRLTQTYSVFYTGILALTDCYSFSSIQKTELPAAQSCYT
ncbi:hypothetical protein NDU88_006595 [Pleurodeles waltl]|uniref:Uncharacterized protein n=1 Tax=Pleurodeles waltl TaxID=8319 RepID=A0AAV7PLI2_PLEWA|nr:hypothetical protein NDU88_006595 [Pleurodeles waltl]